jgi:hypothetical protein
MDILSEARLVNIDQGANITYIQRRNPSKAWVIARFAVTSAITAVDYATLRSNPTQTDYKSAWAARASLTYGEL